MSELDRTPGDLPTFVTSVGDETKRVPLPISKVGRYTITRLIGEGGMGAVYEAEQDQPRRTVALKVIKPGLASPELLRRFAQESQALGRLQHPGIAQIYEAGTADAGYGPQPYFAMEFIRGETLLDYAGKHHLNTRQRLEIVAKICDAVHHAHQRGLIHRDLKPGNILVDETGQPKILDFGVARVTDSDAQATMQTDVGQLVGTLAYMSPEQVLADPLELDTRSDVYALGVILYELLAGRLPYNVSRKIHEALQAIREEDPAKLSSVNRVYRGDIETIVAKALEKDKARRYASAAELAADVQHYLKDEPIVARPPSTSYQLQKFARRHKALVIGLAAVFVVLLAGIVVSTWQAAIARQQAERARRAEEAALRDRDRAAAAEQTATVERDKAVKAQGLAVESETQAKLERDKAVTEKERADTESATAKAVSDFLRKNLFEQVAGQRGASSDLGVSGALDRAAAKIEGAFDKQPLVEAGVREAVADAYLSIALFDKAAPQVERAIATRRRILGVENPATLNAMHNLANIYANQRKNADAEALLAQVVASQRNTLGREHPDTLKSAIDLAAMYAFDGKPEKGEPLAVEVSETRKRKLGPGHRDTAASMIILATVYRNERKNALALSAATTGYEAARRSLGENDPMTSALKTLAQTFDVALNPGDASRKAGLDGLSDLAKALENKPATSLPDMISTTIGLAGLALAQGHPEQAERPLIAALDAVHRAGGEDLLLMTYLVSVQAGQRKYTDAETNLRKLAENPAASNQAQSAIGVNVRPLPFALRNLAAAYRGDKKFSEAEAHLVRLVAVERAVLGDNNQQTRVDMTTLAENYANRNQYPQSEEVLDQVLKLQRQYNSPEGNVLMTVVNLGWVRLQQKKYSEAESTLKEASDGLRRVAPNSTERYYAEIMLGACLAAQRRFEQAEPLLLSGYEGIGRAQRSFPQTTVLGALTQDQAGGEIVRLYVDWMKSDKQTEWVEKLKLRK